MQRSLIVWYVVLMVELVTIIMMGYFYPYVSKWDKRKVKMPQWNDKRRPRVTILQRYKVSGMCVVATIYIVLDFFIPQILLRVRKARNLRRFVFSSLGRILQARYRYRSR